MNVYPCSADKIANLTLKAFTSKPTTNKGISWKHCKSQWMIWLLTFLKVNYIHRYIGLCYMRSLNNSFNIIANHLKAPAHKFRMQRSVENLWYRLSRRAIAWFVNNRINKQITDNFKGPKNCKWTIKASHICT